MIETTTSQAPGRAGWPITTRRAWRKRESKVVYHNNPGYSTRRFPSPPTHTTSPENSTPRRTDISLILPPSNQTAGFGHQNGFDVSQPPSESAVFGPILHQNVLVDDSMFSSFYTLPSNTPTSHMFGNSNPRPSHDQYLQINSDGQEMAWDGTNPSLSNLGSEISDLAMSDLNFGNFDTFDGMGISTPTTATSSLSEGYCFPDITPFESSDNSSQSNDLALSGEFYKIGHDFGRSSPSDVNPTSPLYPEERFQVEGDSLPGSTEWNSGIYATESAQWSSTTLLPPSQHQTSHDTGFGNVSHTPWNSQNAQVSHFQVNTNSGVVTFELEQGLLYGTHLDRQEYLDTGQRANKLLAQEPPSPAANSETGSWAIISYPSSEVASHSSPHSHGSPPSHSASPPPQHEIEHHSHIFSSTPGISKKISRGRQRGLTALERKQARDVREAKACWACHISKTKCSPCSPGKPCEQCARLAGKRRFCLFSCFNDPLESLYTFLVPDYLTGHFTKANVDSFLTRNAASWGTQNMMVKMTWGYRRLLEAEVVALASYENSEMNYHHQTVSNGGSRPTLVRKQSPPLGIPVRAMDDMLDLYGLYIQDIVQSDLAYYVPVAYTDQESALPERLLGVACSFYSAALETDNECDILRQAIEMHVTSVILERSLILDSDSLNRVQIHLNQQYPPRSAPRCAQRQIKLAFFILQQRRIMKVLKDWGAIMWATNATANKDNEWATAFTVFLILILVMDKTLGAAYYFCEGRIKHYGHEARSEQAKFQNLVRLTQTELFDRCKEIFHWKFKTRKGGKEAINPIRDGMDAFQGKPVSGDKSITNLVWDLQAIAQEFEREIRLHRSSNCASDSEYLNAGRLACIFLDDFRSR